MNFLDLETITPALIRSGQSLKLCSDPGRGKSEYSESVPKMMSKLLGKPFGYQTVTMATASPNTLNGFTVPVEHEGRLVSRSTLPEWMQTFNDGFCDQFEHGLLVLEEWGQGEGDTKRAGAELVLNHRIGRHRLPPGWAVWCLSNFASNRSGVTKEFDFIINRWTEIDITDDLAAWEYWALAHGVNPIFIHFVRNYPEVVFSKGVPDKQGPWCTPRSIVRCGKLLTELEDEDGKIPINGATNELATGTIGSAAASQLFSTIKLSHVMPDYNDIIRDPTGTKIPTEPDAKMLVCYQLAHRVTEKTMEPVLAYIERYPKEFAVTFAKSATRRDDTLIDTAAFSKFCVNNQSLLGVITRAKL